MYFIPVKVVHLKCTLNDHRHTSTSLPGELTVRFQIIPPYS